MEKKRLTAVKAKIRQITNGKYMPQEGFNPNYVLAKNGVRLSRVRLLATVVDKFVAESGKFASITLDDGTDTIRAKIFNALSLLETVNTGDIVYTIGRVKEYQGEIYIMPEVIMQCQDPNIVTLFELEIRQQMDEWKRKREIVLEHKAQVSDLAELKRFLRERFGIDEEEVEGIMASSENEEEAVEEKNNKQKVLELMVTLDAGQGCDYTDLIAQSGISEEDVDSVVNELLEEGVCFEPKPGKIKKL